MSLSAWFDGLIVTLLLIGLPVALIFAWIFELTPEGVVRTADVLEGESITQQTGRGVDYAIVAGIIALAVIVMCSDPPRCNTIESCCKVGRTASPVCKAYCRGRIRSTMTRPSASSVPRTST
jgi:hypothetical protein